MAPQTHRFTVKSDQGRNFTRAGGEIANDDAQTWWVRFAYDPSMGRNLCSLTRQKDIRRSQHRDRASFICGDSWRCPFPISHGFLSLLFTPSAKSCHQRHPKVTSYFVSPTATQKCHPVCALRVAYSKTRCSYLLSRGYACDENLNRVLSSKSNHKLHVL